MPTGGLDAVDPVQLRVVPIPVVHHIASDFGYDRAAPTSFGFVKGEYLDGSWIPGFILHAFSGMNQAFSGGVFHASSLRLRSPVLFVGTDELIDIEIIQVLLFVCFSPPVLPLCLSLLEF